jgi:hypothetical protein
MQRRDSVCTVSFRHATNSTEAVNWGCIAQRPQATFDPLAQTLLWWLASSNILLKSPH